MKKNKAFKIILIIVIILIAALGAIIGLPKAFATVSNSVAVSSHTKKAALMVAHRGLSGIFPQNTMPAFEGAVEYGFDGAECDIHTTKDGKWVIIHDDTVDKMTDGTGNVEDFTFEQIQELNIDAGNGIENYAELKIPTFEEYMALCASSDIMPVIEIKKCDEKYLPDLKEIIDSYTLKKAPVIISFNRNYLEKYRELDSKIDMMLLATKPTTDDVQWCIDNNTALNFHFAYFAQCYDAIKLAKENNIRLAAWTVDNPVYEDFMVLFGVEVITTNKLLP